MDAIKSKLYKTLRQSERLFKTDMVYLARGGFWLTLVQITGAASAFILSIVFANLFPKDAYGTYKYIIALSGIIGTLTLTGLGPAITQSVARGYDAALSKGFRTVLRWGVIIFIVSLSSSGYYFLHKNYLLAFSFLLIAITSPLIDAASFFGSYLAGKKNFKTLSILTIINNTVPTLAIIIALLMTQSLWIIILTYFLSNTLVIFGSYLYTVVRYKPGGKEDPEMVPYAKHLTFITVLNTIADQADKIIVYHYVGAVELAIYVFATAFPTQIKGVFKGLSPLAFPKFAIRSLDETRQDVPGKMLRFLSIITPIVLLYIIIAPYLYTLFFPQYVDAVPMSRIFALSLLPYISIIPTTILQAKKSIRSLYGSNISIAIMKLVFLFTGVSLAGVWGVVYARVAYEFGALMIALYYLHHAEEISPSV